MRANIKIAPESIHSPLLPSVHTHVCSHISSTLAKGAHGPIDWSVEVVVLRDGLGHIPRARHALRTASGAAGDSTYVCIKIMAINTPHLPRKAIVRDRRTQLNAERPVSHGRSDCRALDPREPRVATMILCRISAEILPLGKQPCHPP
jgi:hypothetical protein